MRTSSGGKSRGIVVAIMFALTLAVTPPSARAQSSAADAALGFANSIDGASGGISRDDLFDVLEVAAAAGQPMALWRLGIMYENGEGVEKDPVKAFGYFSQIANDNANTLPRSLNADIVAQSFLKVGDYYQAGLPDAGIPADSRRAHTLVLHAASYFGDPDAQYRVGKLYLDDTGLGESPLQSARWLHLAARKGHAAAQATLGDMLFHGEGIDRQPIEGLMWLALADHRARGTTESVWIAELLSRAMSIATPRERAEAVEAAESLSPMFGGL